MKKVTKISLVALLLTVDACGQGTILWQESVNGQLSKTSDVPTSLMPVQAGTNSVLGTTEVVPSGSSWLIFADFFTIQVPSNLSVIEAWITVSKPHVSAWIGNTTFVTELAYLGNASNGSLLAQWGLTSIGAGTYGLDIENHDFQSNPSATDYRLDFVTQSVPEPSSVCLLPLGAALLLWLRRKNAP